MPLPTTQSRGRSDDLARVAAIRAKVGFTTYRFTDDQLIEMPSVDLIDHVAQRVEFREDGRWNWTGYVNPHGYGQVTPRITGRRTSAHRAVYELLVEPVASGLHVDHLCRNPTCVNPDHLEPVTPRENTMRGIGLTARQARQTHCIHGHPFDESNTHIKRTGARYCLTCHRQREARRRSRSPD